MTVERFEDLLIWQRAKELTLLIYKTFSKNKDFSFKKQIERASVSIMNNIAEGFERRSNKDFRQFLFFAKGSSGEVRNMLHLARELNYIDENEYHNFLKLSLDISKMTAGLIRKL
ncbi:MAG: four helix bundle protein [Bacteroidota bacterium]|nr:four helix bundle protein [Bacteroidota bacterium]